MRIIYLTLIGLVFAGCHNSKVTGLNDEDSNHSHESSENEESHDSANPSPETSTTDSSTDSTTDSTNSAPSTNSPSSLCQETKLGERMIRRLTVREIHNTFSDLFPDVSEQWSGLQMGPDAIGRDKFSNDRSLIIGKQAAANLLKSAENLASLVVSEPQYFSDCEKPYGTRCARDFLHRHGHRLFRRPLHETEVTSYIQTFEDIREQSDFYEGLKWMLVSLLQSPNTIYRQELGQVEGNRIRLKPFEIATALAYTFSNTTPSDELLRQAEEGELESPKEIEDAARKLLNSQRGREAFLEFFREWLGYQEVLVKTKSNITDFPEIRSYLRKETDKFLESLLFEDSGTIGDLLTADYSFVDNHLASYYGIPESSEEGFQRVRRNHGRGVLAQGSILSAKAQSEFSSPTQRGLLIFEAFLCQHRPLPPDQIPMIAPVDPGNTTTRERYELLHAQGQCASCHQAFDPWGFAFEHFDEGGRFRETEFGLEIDATGVGRYQGKKIISFADQEDMVTQLSSQPKVIMCIGDKLTQFAFADQVACLADKNSRDQLLNGTISLFDYYVRMTRAPHFMERQ